MTASTRTRPSTARRLATLLGLTLAGMLTLAGPASAHTELTGSDPADGATVTSPPASVTLTFNEQVQAFLPTVVVTGPDGQPYTAGDPTPSGSNISAPLKPLGPAGPYTVAYRIVSADDHPVTGQITFTYTPPTPTAAAGSTGAATAPPPVASSADRSVPTQPSPAPGTTSSSADTAVTSVDTTPTVATTGTGPAGWVWVAGLAGAVLIAGVAWIVNCRIIWHLLTTIFGTVSWCRRQAFGGRRG